MHISEDKLEILAFAPELLDGNERTTLLAHLNSCKFCMENFHLVNKTFVEIDEELNKPPTTKDDEVAKKIFFKSNKNKSKVLLQNNSAVQIYDGKVQIVPRQRNLALSDIWFFLKRRPFLGGSIVFTAVALITAMLTFTYKSITVNTNPVYGEIKNGILEVISNDGEILWKKTVGNLPDRKLDQSLSYWYDKDRKTYFTIVDIDNDNKNEILLSGTIDNSLYAADSLYCFDYKGKLRWAASPGKFMNFGTERWKHTKWYINDFFTVKSSGKNQIIVIANDKTYAPLIVSKLNPLNGTVISSYYHCGWNVSKKAEKLDLNNDGSEEIIMGLTNNAYKQAALLILSPNNLEGMAPANQLFYPPINKGKEIYYIIFPITNFAKKFARSYQFDIYEISLGESGITVNTTETPGNLEIEGSILYSFNRNLETVGAIGSQEFNRKYDEEYRKGTFAEPRDSNYFKNIVDSVQYWDGDKFVNYHTMNKYYKLDSLLQNLP